MHPFQVPVPYIFCRCIRIPTTTNTASVVDPNTLNLDPDPGLPVYNQFWKKKFKIILGNNNLLWNKYIFLNCKNKLSPKEIFNHLGLWIVGWYLKSYIFCLHFNIYLHVWIRIRIQEAPEYGSNTDPDPQHC